MNEDFGHIFEDIKRESLTGTERAQMREALLSHMERNPAKAPWSVRIASPISILSGIFAAPRPSNLRLAPAGVALVFVATFGTAYAAEGALPGDALYAIKRGVNEPLQEVLALSDEAQVSWQTEKIERRLVEAEALIAKGNLTPIAQTDLETEIQTSVQKIDKSIEKIALKSGTTAVAAAQSDLEAALIGHAEVLVALSSALDTATAAEPIVLSVLSQAEQAQSARLSHEADAVAQKDGRAIRAAAFQNKEKARQAVNTVRAKASSALVAGTTTAEVAKTGASVAEEAITEAEEKLKVGDYGAAFATFQEVLRTVKTIEVHLDASERLNTDVRVFTRSPADAGVDAALMMTAEPAKE